VSDFEIKKALAFIDEHIEEKLFLNDIADNLGYSPFYVSRIFSQIMGISIVSYVRMRKLQYAFLALQNCKTILEVAYQYGFESHDGVFIAKGIYCRNAKWILFKNKYIFVAK